MHLSRHKIHVTDSDRKAKCFSLDRLNFAEILSLSTWLHTGEEYVWLEVVLSPELRMGYTEFL